MYKLWIRVNGIWHLYAVMKASTLFQNTVKRAEDQFGEEDVMVEIDEFFAEDNDLMTSFPDSPETEAFQIGDIISVISDRLVSHDHMGGIYKILSWMTGEELMTHQLNRAADACKPYLVELFPEIAQITVPNFEHVGDKEKAVFEWVDSMSEIYGVWHDVPKLPEGAWDHKNALDELAAIAIRGR